MFLRTYKIMWLMIDAINNGYVEFRATIYGGHPGRYWSGLLEEAHFLDIGHFNSLGRSVIFKLTLIESPHFCAVIHGYDLEQCLLMDSAVAEFVGVDECRYFRDTDFPKYHFSKGDFNPMLHFFGEWSKDERVSTKMSSLSMDNVPHYVSSYFTKWSTNIIEYVSTIGNQICLSDLTIQHLASFYGHRGGKGNLGKHQTAEHRANISMALSGKVFTDRGKGNLGKYQTAEHRANINQVQDDKWIDNLANCRTFFVAAGRMPNRRADNVVERSLGLWIANNKYVYGGTNSDREQLMRREIPLAFEANIGRQLQDDKWIDNLANCKTFFVAAGRMPNRRADNVDKRRLGTWIANNKRKEGGTNSEREHLMRREIPLALANR